MWNEKGGHWSLPRVYIYILVSTSPDPQAELTHTHTPPRLRVALRRKHQAYSVALLHSCRAFTKILRLPYLLQFPRCPRLSKKWECSE